MPRELFDASEIDWEDLPPLFDETERLTGIDDADDPMLWVSREVWADEKPSDPQVHVSVSDDYHDGSVDFAVDGTVVGTSGGAPGSEAAAADDDA